VNGFAHKINNKQESATLHRPTQLPVFTAIFGIALLLGPCAGSRAMADSDEGAYTLGPGDQIIITVFGEEDLSMTFRLNDTGTLNYPFIGELKVEGLTVVELEQQVTQGLKGRYLVNPDVAVSIGEYRPFFLHGEVKRPGGYPYQPGLTVQQAIALGGGFTERASRRKVDVIRSSDPTATAQRIKLAEPVGPGDVVIVLESFF
jgi:polysaccharide export outer membrane protein